MNKRSSIIGLFFLTIAPFSGDRVEAMDMGPDPSMPFLASMDDACIPNFTHEQWVVAPQHIVNSLHDGNWNTAANWDGPLDANAVVRVNNNITLDADADVYSLGIYPSATLSINTAGSATLKVVDLIVHTGGTLSIDERNSPSATVNVVFRDVPINTANASASFLDPGQYGNGMLIFGAAHIHGAVKDPTFVRLAAEPKAGDTTLSLSAPVSGWQAGDQIILPDTRFLDWNEWGDSYKPQWELFTVTGISGGKTISVDHPLAFDHKGGHTVAGVLKYLPHVGNITRNIVFKSENENGVRGHTISFGRADVDIEYAAFDNLSRTTNQPRDNTTFDSNCNATHVGANQIARYPLHTHHLVGLMGLAADQPQFKLIGNAIDSGDAGMAQGRRWGITIHASHYGEIANNVIYRTVGAGFVFEDGSETGNKVHDNFVCEIVGTGSKESGEGDGLSFFGDGGDGFWLRSQRNYVTNNVVANNYQGSAYAYGYIIPLRYLGNVTIPAYKGAMPGMGDITQEMTIDGNGTPITEFSNNEVYGGASGMTVWWLGSFGRDPHGDGGTIEKLTIWNERDWAFFGYDSSNLTLDNVVALGDVTVPGAAGTGLYFADYSQSHLTISNCDIQGMDDGIQFPTVGSNGFLIQNCTLQNKTNIWGVPPGSTAGNAGFMPRIQVVRDCLFSGIPSRPGYDIDLTFTHDNMMEKEQTFVYNFNKVQGNNFQVFYHEQVPDFVVPTSAYPRTDGGSYQSVGAPAGDVGLTNAQLAAKYPQGVTIFGDFYNPVAIASEIAFCNDTTTNPNVNGITCPVSAIAPPTVAMPANATPNPVTGTTTNLSVLGASGSGESTLTYMWSVVGTPPAPTTFSANGSNVAKNTTATFSQGGAYNLQVTIQDAAGQSVTSQVTVAVNQTLTTLSLTPTNDSVGINRTKQFTATALDQFNQPLASQPSLTWSVNGGGSINSAGLFTAGSSVGGPFIVTATGGGQTATAQITITLSQPPNISVTSPSNRATFTTPAAITIRGNASDDDGSVSMVEFFANGKSIGMIMSSFSPFSFIWSILTAGNYTLTAVATDNQNTQTTSPPLFITVTAPTSGGKGPTNEGGNSGPALSDFVVDVRAGTVTPAFPQNMRLNFYTRQGKEILSTQNPTPDMFRNFAMGIYVCRPDGTGASAKTRKVFVKK